MKKTAILFLYLLFILSTASISSQSIAYGVVNSKGEEIIPFRYRYISPLIYSDTYLAKNTDGLYGTIDMEGNEVIPFRYESEPFFYRNYILFEKNKQWGILDKKGNEIVSPRYYHLMYLTDSLLAVMPAEEENSYGVMDTHGNILIKPEYENIRAFNDTLLVVRKKKEEGLINKQGKEIIPCGYNSLWDKNPNYVVAYSYKKDNYLDSYSIFNLEGKLITTRTYRTITYLGDSTAIVKKDNKSFSFIRLDGKDSEIKDFDYDDIEYLGNNLFSIKKRYNYALMNMGMKELTPFGYDYISVYYDRYKKKSCFRAQKEGRYALLDEKYKIAVPFIFKSYPDDSTGKYFIDFDEETRKWIVIDRKGKIQADSEEKITSYTRCYNHMNFSKFRNENGRINIPHTESEIRVGLPDNQVVTSYFDEEKDCYLYSVYDVKKKKTIVPFCEAINYYDRHNNTFVTGKRID